MIRTVISHSIIVVGLVVLAAGAGVAQDQKIGYVNTDEILSQMSEYQGIQKQLDAISSEWNAELEEMQQEIEQLKEDFQAKEILYTDELKQQKQQEIQSKIQERQQYLDQKFGNKGEYFQKQNELLEPIQRKIYEAINTVANQQNFDFIFDRAENPSLLYSENEWNLNEQVLQELGISLDEASN